MQQELTQKVRNDAILSEKQCENLQCSSKTDIAVRDIPRELRSFKLVFLFEHQV